MVKKGRDAKDARVSAAATASTYSGFWVARCTKPRRIRSRSITMVSDPIRISSSASTIQGLENSAARAKT